MPPFAGFDDYITLGIRAGDSDHSRHEFQLAFPQLPNHELYTAVRLVTPETDNFARSYALKIKL